MRGTFARTLVELAARDPRVMLLTGDLGFMALEPFAEAHPERFVNCGVAEQNMLGVGAGLAEAGFLPFAYSIATFATLRGYESFRNGAVLAGLPVRLVGVGGGFEYGPAGPTHHALEDLAVMRPLVGLTVVAPADFAQARAALLATWDLPGPVYYRLGKDDRATVPGLDGRFAVGSVEIVREGPDLLILALGAAAVPAATAADLLAADGMRATLGVVAAVSPPPDEALRGLLGRFDTVMTVEAHYAVGGLGSLVAETVADHGLGCRVVRAGVRTPTEGSTGSQAFLEERHGLSPARLAQAARDCRRVPTG